jgi:hypothetical protein
VLARVVEGRELESEKVYPDDPKAEAAIAMWNKRLHADHYTLLSADFDADRSDVRAQAAPRPARRSPSWRPAPSPSGRRRR